MLRYPDSKSYISPDTIQEAIKGIIEESDATSSVEVLGACCALAEAGRYGALPIEEGVVEKAVDRLISLVKTTKDSKVVEKREGSNGKAMLNLS